MRLKSSNPHEVSEALLASLPTSAKIDVDGELIPVAEYKPGTDPDPAPKPKGKTADLKL